MRMRMDLGLDREMGGSVLVCGLWVRGVGLRRLDSFDVSLLLVFCRWSLHPRGKVGGGRFLVLLGIGGRVSTKG